MKSVKIIGSSGQISLGKQYAGRRVLVEETEPGVWLVRTAKVIPDDERWLQHSKASNDLMDALAWAQKHTPDDSGADDFMARINP